ncbi:MAG: 16S rRNA (uracil(1498)-N(3))-methyltransferase [Rhodoferax sp.]
MAQPPRFHCPVPLASGAPLELPPGAARHVQVLRLQPGAPIVLFGMTDATGTAVGGECDATVLEMGRQAVRVQVGRHRPVERESQRRIHLAIGMPANERMDWLVEKATELGAASVQALTTERTVVRLDGERAQRRAAHWQSIAVAACEQCGRNQVPDTPAPQGLRAWLQGLPPAAGTGLRMLLSFRPDARVWAPPDAAQAGDCTVLIGPEGGLSAPEEQLALDHGFMPVQLGPRVLRAETAAIAALTLLA